MAEFRPTGECDSTREDSAGRPGPETAGRARVRPGKFIA